jgi:hypothetical protein
LTDQPLTATSKTDGWVRQNCPPGFCFAFLEKSAEYGGQKSRGCGDFQRDVPRLGMHPESSFVPDARCRADCKMR